MPPDAEVSAWCQRQPPPALDPLPQPKLKPKATAASGDDLPDPANQNLIWQPMMHPGHQAAELLTHTPALTLHHPLPTTSRWAGKLANRLTTCPRKVKARS